MYSFCPRRLGGAIAPSPSGFTLPCPFHILQSVRSVNCEKNTDKCRHLIWKQLMQESDWSSEPSLRESDCPAWWWGVVGISDKSVSRGDTTFVNHPRHLAGVVTTIIQWPRRNSCRKEVCGHVWFLYGCLNVSYRSWDTSKNPCLWGDRTFPNKVQHQGLGSTRP